MRIPVLYILAATQVAPRNPSIKITTDGTICVQMSTPKGIRIIMAIGDVSGILDAIAAAPEKSVIYFPAGKYVLHPLVPKTTRACRNNRAAVHPTWLASSICRSDRHVLTAYSARPAYHRHVNNDWGKLPGRDKEPFLIPSRPSGLQQVGYYGRTGNWAGIFER